MNIAARTYTGAGRGGGGGRGDAVDPSLVFCSELVLIRIWYRPKQGITVNGVHEVGNTSQIDQQTCEEGQ